MHGLSYYRIRQTDFNGDFDFSDVITIRNYNALKSNANTIVYPNPVINGLVNLNVLNHPGETVNLSITDVYGKTLIQKQIQLSGSYISIYLNDIYGNTLSPGLYSLQVNTAIEVFQQKLILK